jgi:ATP synthase protein I
MANDSEAKHSPKEKANRDYLKQVTKKEARKIYAREHEEENVWFWLGMMGMVGWAVAIPTLIGVALGVWLDKAYPVKFSWTLTFLFIGVVLGCFNAWRWINKESRNK